MENISKWILNETEKVNLINSLTSQLLYLRSIVGISQEELSSLIGISRQSYGQIERGTKQMSWSAYLSLIMFFDYNHKTHELLRTLKLFPEDLVKKFNDNLKVYDYKNDIVLGGDMKTIIDNLDEQAIRTIKTLVMVEYSRCIEDDEDVIVKSFDGNSFQLEKAKKSRILDCIQKLKSKNI